MTFNMLSKFSIKSLVFIIGVLTTVAPCIHACHATQYARLAEAYKPTLLHEEVDTPEKREAKLDHALKELSGVRRIYRFDSTILTSDGLAPHALDFTSLDLDMALSLSAFYSQDRNERDYAFAQQIKQPLLRVLHDAAEASFKFPTTLRYLYDQRVTGRFQELLDIAVRDLFVDPVEGLPALSTALNGLKTNKKLTGEEERKLRLFKNLAGFFYDLKALQHLRKKNEEALAGNPDISQASGRVTLLRILQLQGEIFKLMLPSTLNLAPTLPSEGLLEGLRDTLSHLSRMKVEKLFSTAPETTAVFKGVLADIIKLNDGLKAIEAQYLAVTSALSPPQQWAHIKGLSDIRNEVLPLTQWPGIDSLLNLLQPPAAPLGVALPPQPYAAEIDELAPLSADRIENEVYFDVRTKLYDVLNRKGKALDDSKEFHDKLTNCGIVIDASRADVIRMQLRDAQNQISQFYIAKQLAQAAQKKEEVNALINQLILDLMGKSLDQHRTYEERREIIRKEEARRQDLRRLLDQTKPSRGFGNLSEKFDDFCDKLRELGIVLPPSSFDWNKEPETVFERIFHKVHRTGLYSKQAKNDLRGDRIQSLLEFIAFLRNQLGMETCLEFESEKETHKIIIEGKAKLVGDSIRALGNIKDSSIDQFWELQRKLYELGKECFMLTQAELAPLQDRADQYIYAFLSQYEAYFPQPTPAQIQTISTLKQELLNKARGISMLRLRGFIREQQVQKNHRFHRPTLVEESLKPRLKAQTSLIPVNEFLVSTFYELLKEVTDYPELIQLQDTDQIRNHFSHVDPFELEPLRVKSSNTFDSGTYLNNPTGTLAKELAILGINVRYLLEEFLRTVK